MSAEEPRIYPCRECGAMRTKSEGGTIFTVCDGCWDKSCPQADALHGVIATGANRITDPTTEAIEHLTAVRLRLETENDHLREEIAARTIETAAMIAERDLLRAETAAIEAETARLRAETALAERHAEKMECRAEELERRAEELEQELAQKLRESAP